jgi:hypothetical protein
VLPTPHLEKLNAALANPKLPAADIPRINNAKAVYQQWITDLNNVTVPNVGDPLVRIKTVVAVMAPLLNKYKRFVDLELIFDSPEDFLYRQKGQTTLDNSIIEEFLPHLVTKCIERIGGDPTIQLGPKNAFSAIYFTSSLDNRIVGGGLHARTKDQDFTIARRVFLKSSYYQDFREPQSTDFFIAYVAAECKTNLDKTMFQEACATAHDVKSSVAGSRYFLLCEWLDMTPQSTAATDIDEVLLLRRAKRLGSQERAKFGTVASRAANRGRYAAYLDQHPFSESVLERFVEHILSLVSPIDIVEDDVLKGGFF